MSPFLQGAVIGISIAAPVGPIGVLCLRRSLTDGRAAGFVSGLGAATADAAYGVIAALGLNAVTRLLLDHQRWLQLGGGAFLVYLGVATIRSKGGGPAAPTPDTRSLRSAYFSTLVLTLTNPMTILSFVGIFAGLGLGAAAGAGPAALLVLGVFLGSAAWWLILSSTASWLGQRIQQGGLRALNLASGFVIAAFGLWQLAKLW